MNHYLAAHISSSNKLVDVTNLPPIKNPLDSALDFFESKLGTRDPKKILKHYKKNQALGIEISFLQDLKDFT